MNKKFISALMILVLSFGVNGTSFAAENTSDEYQVKHQELIIDGLTEKEASTIIRIEKITKEMEVNGQTIDLVNGEATISREKENKREISKEDEKFYIELAKNKIKFDNKMPKESYEEKKEQLLKMMQENPGRHKYRITYEDGSWYECVFSAKQIDTEKNTETKTYGYEDVEVATFYFPWSGDGTYYYDYEFRELSAAGSYAKVYIGENITVSNNGYNVHVNYGQASQASYGNIGIANHAMYVHVNDTDYYQDPTLWCYVENSVVFARSGSVGVTLGGIFSFSITAGANWTQSAYIKTSLSALHHFARVYY